MRKLLLFFAVPFFLSGVWVQRAGAYPLTFMSFNVRYGTANDGKNSWRYRKNILFKVIQ